MAKNWNFIDTKKLLSDFQVLVIYFLNFTKEKTNEIKKGKDS